jgi:hypothetical protein
MPNSAITRGLVRPAAGALVAFAAALPRLAAAHDATLLTRVEIFQSQPRRVFDRAVVKTLSRWRYNAGKQGS